MNATHTGTHRSSATLAEVTTVRQVAAASTIQQESQSILHDGDVDEESELRPLQETSKLSMRDSEFCLLRLLARHQGEHAKVVYTARPRVVSEAARRTDVRQR